MMFRVLSMVVIGFSAITLQSCAVENDDTFSTTGTLIELQVETIIGAEYEIAGDDGNGYHPINLPAEFGKDKLRVRFEAQILHNRSDFYGIFVEIVHIERL
jgi:hypothetical protein